jgi:hypothetical protein
MTAAALECQSCRDAAILTHRVNIIKLTKAREIARYTLAAPLALERDSPLEIHRQNRCSSVELGRLQTR